ncbi:MAG: hypothetical protein LBJ36_04695 [Synergistaceae bacterium]|jgi:hypothetical protein|nr:hypothetical protein [Synergistaceae bacterium]
MHTIEHLSDKAILRIRGYIERVREEEEEEELEREAEEEERRYQSMTFDEIETEIAVLEAKYGTTPNAETMAAMREAEQGIVEPVTLEEIKAECDALRYRNSRL